MKNNHLLQIEPSMKKTLILLMTISLYACQSDKQQVSNSFLPKINYENIEKKETTLSRLFETYRLIQLETTDSCLTKNIRKIKKYNHKFYIHSENEIIVFGTDGKFITKLNCYGNGPEDYIMLNDFDIIDDNTNPEIWIGSIDGIVCYTLDGFKYLRKIKTNECVNQFKFFNKENIVIRTTDEYMFAVCNMKGEISQRFMKKDMANMGYKPVQFLTYHNQFIYQLDATNTGVTYDPEKKNLQKE